MSKVTQTAEAPVGAALVFICEKCGKRLTDGGKNPGHRLASTIKRLAKHELGKGEVRAVLTSCMDMCPDDRVAVSIVATRASPPEFLEVDVEDIDAAGEALMERVRRSPGTSIREVR